MKETLIRKVKKHDNILMIIILIIIALTFFSISKLNADDELWNFSNINKMSKGFIIYEDINIIITPLYFYIGNLIFNIFGANYLIFRIYDRILINVLAFFILYILFKKMNIKKKNAMIYTMAIAIEVLIIYASANYNILAILFTLIGIICEILKKEKNIKDTRKIDITQGIIMFLVFLSKQNIGIYYMLGIILYNILKDTKIKEKIITLLRNFITAGICLAIFLGCLYLGNNLNGFINYTVAGISEFASKNLKGNYANIIFIIMKVIIDIALIVITYNKKIKLENSQKNTIKLLSSVSLIMTFAAFPLINLVHTMIASIVFIIALIYTLDTMILNEIFASEKMIKIKNRTIQIILIIMFIIGTIANVIYISKIKDKNYYFDKNSPYYGVIAEEQTIEEIKEICNYIKEQNNKGIEVKVISYYSNLYMNILNKNNKDMDLPFYGNLGKEGENGLIKKVANLTNTKILILTQEDNYYQESKNTMKFIKENLEYEGTINRFSIYNKK